MTQWLNSEWLDHYQDQNPKENERDCGVQDLALLALEPDAEVRLIPL